MSANVEVLEVALRVMSLALDALISDCIDVKGSAKAPERAALMKARSMLPPYCAQALSQKKPA